MCGLLSCCDATVNPIRKGTAASIINKHGDYAASGLPVINTQETSEYRRLVSDGNCGINCDNSAQVAEAILYLMKNEEAALTMGRNSRRIAEEYFDRAVSYEKIYRLFE